VVVFDPTVGQQPEGDLYVLVVCGTSSSKFFCDRGSSFATSYVAEFPRSIGNGFV